MSAFLDLHRPGDPLVLPNPWDVGSARLFEHLGFAALATTSSGFAATLGRVDGDVTRKEVLAHARELVAAVSVPVSADLEHGFGATEAEVTETFRLAAATGLAGGSIEDWDGTRTFTIDEAAARVAAAVAGSGPGFVVTARCDAHLREPGQTREDTIARLQAYAEAGAQVVYAPGPTDLGDIRALVEAVPRPVNVLLRPGGPGVRELAAAGVARVSVGGMFAFTGLGAVADAARELLDAGTLGGTELAARGGATVRAAFDPPRP